MRIADTLTEVVRDCPYEEGYDLKIGTSDKGVLLERANFQKPQFQDFKHAIVYFGGLEGIEGIIEEEAGTIRIEDAESLFDLYINTCPDQGTATIRTEEAILVSLAGINPCLRKIGRRVNQ